MKWPPFIASTAQMLILVVDDEVEIVHSGCGIYYGVTWDHNSIYVAQRMDMDGNPNPVISKFNSDLTFGGEVLSGNFNDVHQILYVPKHDSLYITATGYNSIVKVSNDEQIWYNWTEHIVDFNHINSLWFDGNNFWFAYHNFVSRGYNTDSQVVRVDESLTTCLEEITLGQDIHNVFIDNGWLMVGNSTNGCLSMVHLESGDYKDVGLGDWVRGISVNDDYMLVGTSQFAERRNRLYGHFEVNLLDRKTHAILDKKVFEDCGAVMDLRIVSGTDDAHNGIQCPYRS